MTGTSPPRPERAKKNMDEKQNQSRLQRAKAVALKKRRREDLPRISASGTGVLAERILDIAFESGVKVRQDSELVDILDAYDVDSPIPLGALTAVSEILRYVYKEDKRLDTTRPEDNQKPDGTTEAGS